jgi:Arc/MetJ-type ribon-helix-helix transcriptional regulator
MYYKKKGASLVENRKVVTISLPPRLLREAERLAAQENRTKSELLREALRLYIETRDVRRKATRERVFSLIDRVQVRTKGIPPQDIRSVVREPVAATRRTKLRASGR